MKVFHCDHCESLVFYENSQCMNCGNTLAYLPDVGEVCSLDQGQDQLWTSPSDRAKGKKYRLCSNYCNANVCNWAVSAEQDNEFCRCCRLTRVIPDLSIAGNDRAWYKLEIAKRQLIYDLLRLQLPVQSKQEDPEQGLAFEFLGNTTQTILTGHENGVITINIAEADDTERERRRSQLHEPVRTLLGHFRHEIGHYYWDRLIANGHRLLEFRQLFGDERQDYSAALQRHYQEGPPADWTESYVSAYASSHPWEDWSETWAHYLMIGDSLETAGACGLSLKPRRRDEPTLKSAPSTNNSFDKLIEAWFPLTYALNNLNRGLGHSDAYPFVLSSRTVEKLRFVHQTIYLNEESQK